MDTGLATYSHEMSSFFAPSLQVRSSVSASASVSTSTSTVNNVRSATGNMDDPSHNNLSNGNGNGGSGNGNGNSHGNGTHLAVDDDGIAYAAQAAADAVVEADALDAANREIGDTSRRLKLRHNSVFAIVMAV